MSRYVGKRSCQSKEGPPCCSRRGGEKISVLYIYETVSYYWWLINMLTGLCWIMPSCLILWLWLSVAVREAELVLPALDLHRFQSCLPTTGQLPWWQWPWWWKCEQIYLLIIFLTNLRHYLISDFVCLCFMHFDWFWERTINFDQYE